MNKVTPEDIKEIHNRPDSKVTLIGEGDWEKDCAYRVYKIEDRFIAILVTDSDSRWLEDNTAEYITEADLSKYI